MDLCIQLDLPMFHVSTCPTGPLGRFSEGYENSKEGGNIDDNGHLPSWSSLFSDKPDIIWNIMKYDDHVDTYVFCLFIYIYIYIYRFIYRYKSARTHAYNVFTMVAHDFPNID